MQHDPSWLRGYLVAGVEDPRINLQSILSRHFLTRSLFGNSFNTLMEHEYCFAAAMNWLSDLARRGGGAEESEVVLHALKQGADNAEGLEIPFFVVETFQQLPREADGLVVPNYLEQFLAIRQEKAALAIREHAFDTFRDLWRLGFSLMSNLVQGEIAQAHDPKFVAQTKSMLEPACGSANDYRFFHSYGLAHWLDYSGFDLCASNIQNAQELFPDVQFRLGNVFEIDASDKAFDLCVVHDLFEHLSVEGMQVALNEICRVTRVGICVGFFQMEEIRDHIVRPLNDYYCNLLSMAHMRELFAECGFRAQVINIGTFLRDQLGCELTHNPNAYTFMLWAE
jgi:ubiquinone/menaquinone biosynthesis C-methylase UbiE